MINLKTSFQKILILVRGCLSLSVSHFFPETLVALVKDMLTKPMVQQPKRLKRWSAAKPKSKFFSKIILIMTSCHLKKRGCFNAMMTSCLELPLWKQAMIIYLIIMSMLKQTYCRPPSNKICRQKGFPSGKSLQNWSQGVKFSVRATAWENISHNLYLFQQTGHMLLKNIRLSAAGSACSMSASYSI